MNLDIGGNGNVINVFLDDEDQYHYTFDRIEGLPESCSVEPKDDPIAVFDAVVTTLSAHYAFFGARDIDWEKVVATERAKVTEKTTDWQLFKLVSRLLSHFRDSHVSLEGTIGDDDLEYEAAADELYHANSTRRESAAALGGASGYWNPRVAEELLGDTARTAADGNIAYGLIDGDIGYLAIRSMSDYSPSEADKALDRALTMFVGAKAVVVDVSMNDGGYDTIARTIAGHFAVRRTLAYSKYPGDSGAVEPQALYVEPRGANRFEGPVFLITSRATVSAAEIFVMAMRALPNVTQVGEATDGSLSDILSKPLPNGWSLSLSNEVYLDSSGVGWEGAGIPPKVAIAVSSGSRATPRAIEAGRRVIDHLRSLASGAPSSAEPS
jgi:carboxyl-terminal processing protease